uniref:Uncharacterized protein n=1 Tax=Glossina austeni TaxID=7395 RepID=A0A1A9VRV8_GLOAU
MLRVFMASPVLAVFENPTSSLDYQQWLWGTCTKCLHMLMRSKLNMKFISNDYFKAFDTQATNRIASTHSPVLLPDMRESCSANINKTTVLLSAAATITAAMATTSQTPNVLMTMMMMSAIMRLHLGIDNATALGAICFYDDFEFASSSFLIENKQQQFRLSFVAEKPLISL